MRLPRGCDHKRASQASDAAGEQRKAGNRRRACTAVAGRTAAMRASGAPRRIDCAAYGGTANAPGRTSWVTDALDQNPSDDLRRQPCPRRRSGSCVTEGSRDGRTPAPSPPEQPSRRTARRAIEPRNVRNLIRAFWYDRNAKGVLSAHRNLLSLAASSDLIAAACQAFAIRITAVTLP